MIITIREPSESEMRRYLLRCNYREESTGWVALNQTKERSLDIYTAFIEAARAGIEHEVFADASTALSVSTAATALTDVERGYGEETGTEAARPVVEVADAPAAEPKTILVKPRAAIKKARVTAAAAQGGLF